MVLVWRHTMRKPPCNTTRKDTKGETKCQLDQETAGNGPWGRSKKKKVQYIWEGSREYQTRIHLTEMNEWLIYLIYPSEMLFFCERSLSVAGQDITLYWITSFSWKGFCSILCFLRSCNKNKYKLNLTCVGWSSRPLVFLTSNILDVFEGKQIIIVVRKQGAVVGMWKK